MFDLSRRHFLRSLLVAAPAIVTAANIMPVRAVKLLLPPKPELITSPEAVAAAMKEVTTIGARIVASERLITLGYRYGTVKHVVYSDGTQGLMLYGQPASRRDLVEIGERFPHLAGIAGRVQPHEGFRVQNGFCLPGLRPWDCDEEA